MKNISNDFEGKPSPFEVEVISSRRHKKNAVARWRAGKIVVMVPEGLDFKSRAQVVESLTLKMLQAADDKTLKERALSLRATIMPEVPLPLSVSWSDAQLHRWGSCRSDTRSIRISTRLLSCPAWVLDGVLIHELAHLAHPDHGKGFKAMVARYSRMGDVEIFLEGFSAGASQLPRGS